MANSPDEVRKAKKVYLLVFGALLVCTVLTVAVATVPWLDVGGHGFDVWDMILGLCIALFKAGLVAFIFMHLNHERKAVYWIFLSGIVFCAALMLLTGWAYDDPIHFDGFYMGESNLELEDKRTPLQP